MTKLITIGSFASLASIGLAAVVAGPPAFAQNVPGFGSIKVKTIPIHVETPEDSTAGHDWRVAPTPSVASSSMPPLAWTNLPAIKVHTLRCSPPTGETMFPLSAPDDDGIPKR